MTLSEFKNMLDELEATGDIGPDTQVFVDHPARGLQDPVLNTAERFRDNGAHVMIIETPKDTIAEVS